METVEPYMWSCGGVNIDGHGESNASVHKISSGR